MLNEEYDFVEMGVRCAKERMENLNAMADKIEDEYGKDARLEFESGIALVVPVYSQNMFTNTKLDRKTVLNGTKNFGVSDDYNESYLTEENDYNNWKK